MKPINDGHVAKPGLAVVEVAAGDDETAFAVQELLATRWAIAPADRTTHEPGEPGVRLRCYLDMRQAARPVGEEGIRGDMDAAGTPPYQALTSYRAGPASPSGTDSARPSWSTRAR
ncbi:DUF6207 family protein [Streptomyces albogriseolus]|uniref:DUF6207 family protein n=1 Tax=Streptomyces albogriseolus TaxID=1887 RepID=UPI00224E0AB1|nr:DUF6207 family protein [Streptomyces viridodiastaticus]MCX4618016.1 DUF6207 family protein [Streptomyces viridodiastaticus]